MPIVVFGSWAAIGLLIGFIATKLIKSSDGPALGVIVTVASAIVVAAVYSMIGGYSLSEFTPKVLIFAAIGAVAGAVVWHAVRSRFVSHEVQTVRRSY